MLPSYMIPKLIKMKSLPLLVNGKTDRHALLEKFEETQGTSFFTFTNVYCEGSLLQISNETTSSNQLSGHSKLCRCKIT